jgi:hypothetical protein
VRFHVDDLMSSHMDPKVNDHFLVWLNKLYGNYGAVKATRGDRHEYLGMVLDFSQKGTVIVDMCDYVAEMIEESLLVLGPKDTELTPAADDLFAEGIGEPLTKDQADLFHRIAAKGLFVCKRARPDTHPTVAVLCTRVRRPIEDDWKKMVRFIRYLNGTRGDKLYLTAKDLHRIMWHIDASFAVHPDFMSHTGGVMTYGGGALQSISRKQRLNTRSSTEAELVGADDAATLMLWTLLFMEAQGFEITHNILYQDNKSAILLEKNGKRSRALNIRYFFLTDQVAKGNLQIEYESTTEMWGDFMSKPLQGKLFRKFKALIMGHGD